MDLTARMEKDARAQFRNGGGVQKSEAAEIAELMALGINHPARKRFREREKRKKEEKLEKAWISTPLRERPAELRGLKPHTPEPWAIDEAYYQRKTGSFEYQFNAREPWDPAKTLRQGLGYTPWSDYRN